MVIKIEATKDINVEYNGKKHTFKNTQELAKWGRDLINDIAYVNIASAEKTNTSAAESSSEGATSTSSKEGTLSQAEISRRESEILTDQWKNNRDFSYALINIKSNTANKQTLKIYDKDMTITRINKS